MLDDLTPPRPPHPDAVRVAMDVSDDLCAGIRGPKAPACRVLVMQRALYGEESRAELERLVEEEFK
jgi:hypothetical protein